MLCLVARTSTDEVACEDREDHRHQEKTCRQITVQTPEWKVQLSRQTSLFGQPHPVNTGMAGINAHTLRALH